MIRFETLEIMSAGMGDYNPLPDVYNPWRHMSREERTAALDDNISAEDRRYMGAGEVCSILPYTTQNNYDRDRRPRRFKAAVLENEYLRAVFLPELGGRLWSLFDKERGRDLLSTNKVFQPANLAIRDAWFSGGVEFNIGLCGHTPLTCSPMFSRAAKTSSGEEVLQIYEFERIRGVAYGINAYLPEGSRMLYLRNTIENRRDSEVYMYWWSNIAVPETEQTRVVVPADECIGNSYKNGRHLFSRLPIPYIDGVDASYPTRCDHSQDYFFKLRHGADRFITALGGDGYGLIHLSTKELKSRKLFVWGQGSGGLNWQRFLSDGSLRYIEIQAGLAGTQLEHIPMPARTTWQWTEAYGALSCDAVKAFSSDWNEAVAEASGRLTALLGGKSAQEYLEDAVPSEFDSYEDYTAGSGFGALEQLSRGESVSSLYSFGENDLGREQEDWVRLLREGRLPEHSVCDAPASYVSGAEWQERIAESLKRPGGAHWYAYYQLGVTACANNDVDAAVEAFRSSTDCAPNPWSYRNLAIIAWKRDKDLDAACELILKAVAFDCGCVNLYQDCADCLYEARRYSRWIEIYGALSDKLKAHARLRLALARCYLALKDYGSAAKIIRPDFVMADVQEGEASISDVWQEIYLGLLRSEHPDMPEEELRRLRDEKYPIPSALDFRQNTEE